MYAGINAAIEANRATIAITTPMTVARFTVTVEGSHRSGLGLRLVGIVILLTAPRARFQVRTKLTRNAICNCAVSGDSRSTPGVSMRRANWMTRTSAQNPSAIARKAHKFGCLLTRTDPIRAPSILLRPASRHDVRSPS